MFAELCLFACALTLGQQANQNAWQLSPRLGRGLELVYSGACVEESLAPGVKFARHYRFKMRAIVLNERQDGWDVAFLTALQLRHNQPDSNRKGAKKSPYSVRIKIAHVDKMGKITPNFGPAAAAVLNGPPTVEWGCFVAMPGQRVGSNQQWAVAEKGRPPMQWHVAGTERINNTRCVKIKGLQQSPYWDGPRADQAAWKRIDRVWLSAELGTAHKVERIIESREPARTHPTQRIKITYELDWKWTNAAKFSADQRLEYLQVDRFDRESEKLLLRPDYHRSRLNGLIKRIDGYLRGKDAKFLRCMALAQVKHRIELGLRGELAVAHAANKPAIIPEAKVGNKAPDFLVTDVLKKRSVQLYRHLGRPILIFFYNPKTKNGHRVLRMAKEIQDKYKSRVSIFGMADSDDVAFIRRQHSEMGLTCSILDGKGLRRTFGVDATPRIIMIDAEGTVRLAQTGWGIQLPGEIIGRLEKLVEREK